MLAARIALFVAIPTSLVGGALMACGGNSESQEPETAGEVAAALTTYGTPDQIGVFRDGTWYVDANGNGTWDGATRTSADNLFHYGSQGATPFVGTHVTYPAPGEKKISTPSFYAAGLLCVGRKSGGSLHGGADQCYLADLGGAIPVFDDVCLWAFESGAWSRSTCALNGPHDPVDAGSHKQFRFGGTGDIPVLGAWTNTGGVHVGVFNPATGMWRLDSSGDSITWDDPSFGPGDLEYHFGQSGDKPVVGDWSGDGITKIGVFRDGWWLLDKNGNGRYDGPAGGDLEFYFGAPGDIPVVGHWISKSAFVQPVP